MAEIARRIIIENRSNNLYITQRMLYCVGIGDTGMTFLLTPKFATGRFVPVADVIGCRNLRSATRGLLNFPRYNMTSYGRRAYSYAGPHAWPELCYIVILYIRILLPNTCLLNVPTRPHASDFSR